MTSEVEADPASSKVATIGQDLQDTPDDICSQASDKDISSLNVQAEAVKKSAARVKKAAAEVKGKLKGWWLDHLFVSSRSLIISETGRGTTVPTTAAATTPSPVGPLLERAANLSHDAWLLDVVIQKLETVQVHVTEGRSSREGKSAATSCSGFMDLVTECKFCYLFCLAS